MLLVLFDQYVAMVIFMFLDREVLTKRHWLHYGDDSFSTSFVFPESHIASSYMCTEGFDIMMGFCKKDFNGCM